MVTNVRLKKISTGYAKKDLTFFISPKDVEEKILPGGESIAGRDGRRGEGRERNINIPVFGIILMYVRL